MSLMAETLGVDYENVSTRIADTESTGFCNSTAGSHNLCDWYGSGTSV